jgi:hypothetical protein
LLLIEAGWPRRPAISRPRKDGLKEPAVPARGPFAHVRDLSIVVLAIIGVWLLWSQYSYLAGLSWWYDNTRHLAERTAGRRPDYDLSSLPWTVAQPRRIDIEPNGITMVTSDEPFGHQVFAIVDTGRANAVDLLFEADVVSGGVTIGLLQDGKWIAINSSQRAGPFVDGNSAQLTSRRPVTVMIANDNPAGASRLTVKSLRVFLRK